MDLSHIPPRARAVIIDIAASHGLAVETLMGRHQSRAVAAARGEAMAALRGLQFADGRPPSYPRIGAWFARHHTTVMHHCGGMRL
jgi:chromosomal replication initiation ATPase DnaA